MALVRLQDVDWTLSDKRQDIRGRELRDAVGRSLGHIEHMIVDTDQERVVSVRLKDATEYAADDLQIMEDAVYYIPPDGPASAAPAAEVPTEPGAPLGHVPVGEDPPPTEAPFEPARPARPVAAAPSPISQMGEWEENPAVEPPEILVPPGDAAIPAPPSAEPAPAAEPQAPGAYLDADFRHHFDAEYEDRRLRYGDLQFAYRFGFDASQTPPLADRTLPDVEADLRRVFYARFNYPASDSLVWTLAADAVHYGFRLGKR